MGLFTKKVPVQCGKCQKYTDVEVTSFLGLTLSGGVTGVVACIHCGHLIHYYIPTHPIT